MEKHSIRPSEAIRPLIVDCLGMLCPVPIFEAGKALRGLAPGASMLVISDDPGVVPDMKAFCKARRQELVSVEQQGSVIRLLVKRVR